MSATPVAKPSVAGSLWSMTRWPARRWLMAITAAFGTSLLVGLPTAVLPNAFFTRMTPVLWWNYPVWAAAAILVGLTVATYLRPATDIVGSRTARTTIGGVLSAFAIGCPICNKLVVAALGTSGALSLWAPMQPIVAVAAVALLAVTLIWRLRGELACPAPPRRPRVVSVDRSI